MNFSSVNVIANANWSEKGKKLRRYKNRYLIIAVYSNLCSSLLHRLEYQAPMSFEQALSMGRTGRVLPSPVLNGFKPKGQLHARHSDSDEEDWC